MSTILSPNDFYRIVDTEDQFYPAFLDVYSCSFPLHEQRNAQQQKAAFEDYRYHLIVLIDGQTLCSFIAYWDFDDYVYIEHLAVNPLLRGQNRGSQMLSLFAQAVDKTIVLEIDPIIDEVSEKRFHFYEKLGYVRNPYIHDHPAYNPQFKPHRLIILSYPCLLEKPTYERFKSDLTSIVMKV
ncbi:GNAT family N-acetyltransferase [Parabacteroides sp. PF5-9]|uniref:GNAT family N-acetyltransferase n=1 Tax=Parabacteroides sp. PF5-9 TaxID=1742404 RepID=UPI0024760295|nr:GNAT family N-acetyltransferase [Parabacteroides sp. PF5-9]MDH6358374.1 ribosomal protein S18 acetylase RimI-like enzyme [Parabacteroides sp. PF5-9]